jgi:hypothetical protein
MQWPLQMGGRVFDLLRRFVRMAGAWRVILSEWEDRARYDRYIRLIGVPWLRDAWEYARGPATVLFLQEETRS